MSWRLAVRPEVETDIIEAAQWYEQREAGVGSEFIRHVRKVIDELARDPLLYRIRHRKLQVRWVITKPFPHRVVFVVDVDQIIVLGVIHAKRHDHRWKSRVRQ